MLSVACKGVDINTRGGRLWFTHDHYTMNSPMSWGIDGLFPRPSHHPVFNTYNVQERKSERIFNVLWLQSTYSDREGRSLKDLEGYSGSVCPQDGSWSNTLPFCPSKIGIGCKILPFEFLQANDNTSGKYYSSSRMKNI